MTMTPMRPDRTPDARRDGTGGFPDDCGRRPRLCPDAARRQERRRRRGRHAAPRARAARSPFFAVRAIMAATAMSPARLLREQGFEVDVGALGDPARLSGDAAQAFADWDGRPCAAETLDPRDVRSGDRRAVRRRPVAPARRARLADRRADQRLRDAGSGGGRAFGPRRRQWRDRLASCAGARDRDLFPPQARPCAAAGPKRLRQAAPDPDRHRRRGSASKSGRKPFSTRPRSGAATCRGPRRTATNMRAAIWSSPPGRRSAPGRGGSRRARACGSGRASSPSPVPPKRWRSTPPHLTAIMLRGVDGPAQWRDLLADRRFSAVVLGPAFGVGEETRAIVEAILGGVRQGRRAAASASCWTPTP